MRNKYAIVQDEQPRKGHGACTPSADGLRYGTLHQHRPTRRQRSCSQSRQGQREGPLPTSSTTWPHARPRESTKYDEWSTREGVKTPGTLVSLAGSSHKLRAKLRMQGTKTAGHRFHFTLQTCVHFLSDIWRNCPFKKSF